MKKLPRYYEPRKFGTLWCKPATHIVQFSDLEPASSGRWGRRDELDKDLPWRSLLSYWRDFQPFETPTKNLNLST